MKEEIKKWNKLTNRITEAWVIKYFQLEEDVVPEVDWIDVGGIFSYNSYYFSFDTVLECYKHSVKRETLFEWFDYCLENPKSSISLYRYVLSPQEKLKKDQESLEESRKRLKFAQEEFDKALENYNKDEREF